MRFLRGWMVLVTSFALPLLGHADDKTDIETIIDRSIKAQSGDRVKQERLLKVEATLSGSLNTADGAADANQELTLNLPTQLRANFQLATADRKIAVIIASTKETGWRAFNGEVVDLSSVEAEDIRMEVHVHWLQTLVSLNDSRLTLTKMPSTKIQQLPVDVIRVSMKNRPDVDLFFHSDSSMLIKTSFKGREAGNDIIKDTYYSQYKAFEGSLFPTKIVMIHNGRPAASWTVKNVRLLTAIEPTKFTKP